MLPAAAAVKDKLLVVGVGDLVISGNPSQSIVTYALGSCLGVTVYDSTARVGGLLHAMLPTSSIDPEKAERRPGMFVDKGLPRLFHKCYELGAQKRQMVVKVAGGASLQGNVDKQFQIGKRNLVILRKMLWRSGVLIDAEEVGGTIARTMSLDLATGRVTLRTNGVEKEL